MTSPEGNRSRMQSLDQMWAAAAIVIEAQFGPCRPVVFSTPANPRPSPQSACDVRVLELFKGDEVVRESGGAITVRQPGGEFDRGDHIERIVPGSRPLYEPGSRYILFLRRHTLPTETFYSTSSLDADGIYKIRGQSIEAASAKEWARAAAQQGAEALRQALRDRGRSR